jgi:hypothetical protein
MMQLFECDDVGPMEEYVGNKIEMREQRMKLTQPVLLQSFADEFGVKVSRENLPAKPGQILLKGDKKDVLGAEAQMKYRSGVGKLRYLTPWSRPDILNAVREVSRYLQGSWISVCRWQIEDILLHLWIVGMDRKTLSSR